MYDVEKYGRVRRAVLRDGMSRSEAARVFGLDRGTVSKMTQFSEPPGYRLSKQRPRSQMDAHADFVEAILLKDRDEPKKQRHTIKRIYERLCEERGFKGGYTTVRDYVRPRVLSHILPEDAAEPGAGRSQAASAANCSKAGLPAVSN